TTVADVTRVGAPAMRRKSTAPFGTIGGWTSAPHAITGRTVPEPAAWTAATAEPWAARPPPPSADGPRPTRAESSTSAPPAGLVRVIGESPFRLGAYDRAPEPAPHRFRWFRSPAAIDQPSSASRRRRNARSAAFSVRAIAAS